MPPITSATPSPLSPAELSYLHVSLSLSPPIRPDARKPTQFRTLTAETDILPSTHGSSRLIWSDGGECIVGIKAEVEETTPTNSSSWVDVSVEVSGARDDDPLATFLAASVADTLGRKLSSRLSIGERWHWRIFIDILLLTPPISHPATLLSLATHLALRATRLPRLISAAEEDPLFDDDWEASTMLYPTEAAALGDVPAITLLVVAVGENVFFDPTREEMAVADCVLAVSVDHEGKIAGVRSLESGTVSEGGVSREVIKRVTRECMQVGKSVYASLSAVLAASS